MAWTKIKNIIILILLGTNLCLLGFTVGRWVYSRQLQGQAREDAIAFLAGRGIQLQQDQVPQEMLLKPMWVSRDIEQEQKLAAELLAGEVAVQERGAQVYRYYNKNGSVQFHSNGEFSARFTSGAVPVDEQGVEAHAQQIMQRLDIQGEVAQSSKTDRGQTLVFQERWDGVVLLNCQASLNYVHGCLESITGGRRLVGTPVDNTGETPVTVATALMRFYTGVAELGDACTRIDRIVQGYMVTSTISEPMLLVPVWHITTDIRTYQLDTLTGVLSRVAQ